MKLTPQQVQYLQLLQLPVLALEQRIKAELEMNPLLEEADDMELAQEEVKADEPSEEAPADDAVKEQTKTSEEDGYTFEDFMNDDLDGYKVARADSGDEDRDEFPQPADVTLTQKLHDQIRMLDIWEEEKLLCDEIIGNIDEDGYLRRDLSLIVQDLNLAQGLSIPNERAEEILRLIQRLDPPGIAARSLQECLIVQLEVG